MIATHPNNGFLLVSHQLEKPSTCFRRQLYFLCRSLAVGLLSCGFLKETSNIFVNVLVLLRQDRRLQPAEDLVGRMRNVLIPFNFKVYEGLMG